MTTSILKAEPDQLKAAMANAEEEPKAEAQFETIQGTMQRLRDKTQSVVDQLVVDMTSEEMSHQARMNIFNEQLNGQSRVLAMTKAALEIHK